MTPDRLSLLLEARLGCSALVLPVDTAPWTWRTTALRDHAHRSETERLRHELEAAPGLAIEADAVVLLRLPADEVPDLLEEAGSPAVPEVAVPADDLPLELTRDGRRTTYGALAEQVGDAGARWAAFRSAGRGRIDLPVAEIARQVPGSPAHAVRLAHARLLRDTPTSGGEKAVALLGQWPQVCRATGVTGRTRPMALHLEQLATAVLHWLPEPGPAPDGWTAQQVAEAARRVLATGLTAAGIPPPVRI